MARILLSQTLSLTHDPLRLFLPHLITTIRLRSKLPDVSDQDTESDPSKSGSGSGSEIEILGVRRFEEAIHSIVARRMAPDWLLFVPGSSYWVPPPLRSRSASVEEVVGRARRQMDLAAEAAAGSVSSAASVKSPRGWPSLAYFVEDAVHIDSSSGDMLYNTDCILPKVSGVLPQPQPVKKTPEKAASVQSDDEES